MNVIDNLPGVAFDRNLKNNHEFTRMRQISRISTATFVKFVSFVLIVVVFWLWPKAAPSSSAVEEKCLIMNLALYFF